MTGSILPGMLFMPVELMVFLGLMHFPTLWGQQHPGQLHYGCTGASKSIYPGVKAVCMLFSLLGDIGGQMGLFIGASILTILELFDYIYEVRPSPFALFLWRGVSLPALMPGGVVMDQEPSVPNVPTWIINFN